MPSDKKNCYLFLIMISESIDLILDGDFYYEISHGSHSDFITVISLCVYCCGDEDEENSCTTYISLLSTCTEDLPQKALAIIVAGSTSHLISKVQIAKKLYMESYRTSDTFYFDLQRKGRQQKDASGF